ncbi:MAG: hypothetical protein AAF871_03955 [Pseudomonadota bacterium]
MLQHSAIEAEPRSHVTVSVDDLSTAMFALEDYCSTLAAGRDAAFEFEGPDLDVALNRSLDAQVRRSRTNAFLTLAGHALAMWDTWLADEADDRN